MNEASILTFIASLVCLSLQVKASDTISADGSFAQTINGQILCNEIVRNEGTDLDDGIPMHYSSFSCIVDPSYTLTGSKHIELTLENLEQEDEFKKQHKDAEAVGKTRLRILGGKIDRSTIVLPSIGDRNEDLILDSSICLARTDNASHIVPNDGRKFECREPTLNWLSAPTNDSKKRKLAVNQTGNKSILVFRVTTSTFGSPTSSAAELSDNVFGPVDAVNIASHFAACSNNKLDFYPAAPVGLTLSATGVYDIPISTSASSTRWDVRNAVVSQVGDAIIDQVDHYFVQTPIGVPRNNDCGGTDWGAIATKPGKWSLYNDQRILFSQTQMHEVGHNLNLAHSGEGDDCYDDFSCIMGYSSGSNYDVKKCFNAAKMSELGWYSDRAAVINPLQGEEFNGKIIGVADYSKSSPSHILFLEIKTPNEENSYFLTYNRKKGINSYTYYMDNQIVVVEGAPNEQSWVLEAISPGETYKLSNYLNGRYLEITLGDAAKDGRVDYVPVTVKLESVGCSSASDCPTNQSCTSSTCTLGKCVYTTSQNCCGNGICETSDGGCGSCPSDCKFPTDCNKIDYRSDGSVGGFYSTTAGGIVFDVLMKTDVHVYEIEVDLTYKWGRGLPAKIYTKSGSYASDSNLNNWQKVFDATSSTTGSYQTLMRFSSRVYSGAGSTRAFYISFESTDEEFYFGEDITASNSDGSILAAGQILYIQQGDTLPESKYGGSFEGGVKYDYATSDKPSCSDSTDFFQATKPGDQGWVKMKTCAGWVGRKSTAWKCYNVGGVKEACPKTCTNCCVDTNGTFVLDGNKKEKTCDWAKVNAEARCKKPPTRLMCPNACGQCN